ncbi:hypothetical protein ACUXV3_01180 [Roseobacteraceae bacterium NS-SX3]
MSAPDINIESRDGRHTLAMPGIRAAAVFTLIHVAAFVLLAAIVEWQRDTAEAPPTAAEVQAVIAAAGS